jgi:hypothetical protein
MNDMTEVGRVVYRIPELDIIKTGMAPAAAGWSISEKD